MLYKVCKLIFKSWEIFELFCANELNAQCALDTKINYVKNINTELYVVCEAWRTEKQL